MLMLILYSRHASHIALCIPGHMIESEECNRHTAENFTCEGSVLRLALLDITTVCRPRPEVEGFNSIYHWIRCVEERLHCIGYQQLHRAGAICAARGLCCCHVVDQIHGERHGHRAVLAISEQRQSSRLIDLKSDDTEGRSEITARGSPARTGAYSLRSYLFPNTLPLNLTYTIRSTPTTRTTLSGVGLS